MGDYQRIWYEHVGLMRHESVAHPDAKQINPKVHRGCPVTIFVHNLQGFTYWTTS